MKLKDRFKEIKVPFPKFVDGVKEERPIRITGNARFSDIDIDKQFIYRDEILVKTSHRTAASTSSRGKNKFIFAIGDIIKTFVYTDVLNNIRKGLKPYEVDCNIDPFVEEWSQEIADYLEATIKTNSYNIIKKYPKYDNTNFYQKQFNPEPCFTLSTLNQIQAQIDRERGNIPIEYLKLELKNNI